MINCEKAGQLIEQKEFEKIGWFRKRKLKLHLKVCKMCRKYDEDNIVLSKIIRMAGVQFSDRQISAEDKERIKAHLTNHL
ncbi:MAG: hypothetical protein HUJ25_07035 [Crocinitomicaceae bacterium]|nr:hypothetical protein [Crocinitomicaceae bacterium]